MIIINNSNTNPYFNIASEEYFLKNFSDDIIMLYRNEPSVIIGKHQNSAAEVNQKFLYNNNIPVIRRLSGGGTVYHDLGNVNFLYIVSGEKGKLVDFRKYTIPIINYINSLGINAVLGERNNIFINNQKVSGNAEHIFKQRVLHHGTLLFNSNLNNLINSIDNSSNYNDKAVRSVRSKVGNISDFIESQITIDQFINKLSSYLSNLYSCVLYYLNKQDEVEISKLVTKKYATWKWNYGYSPNYEIDRTIKHNKKTLTIIIKVEKGIMSNISISGNALENSIIKYLEKGLLNEKHIYERILKIVSSTKINNSLKEILLNNLL